MTYASGLVLGSASVNNLSAETPARLGVPYATSLPAL
jgi:hypothetical protein